MNKNLLDVEQITDVTKEPINIVSFPTQSNTKLFFVQEEDRFNGRVNTLSDVNIRLGIGSTSVIHPYYHNDFSRTKISYVCSYNESLNKQTQAFNRPGVDFVSRQIQLGNDNFTTKYLFPSSPITALTKTEINNTYEYYTIKGDQANHMQWVTSFACKDGDEWKVLTIKLEEGTERNILYVLPHTTKRVGGHKYSRAFFWIRQKAVEIDGNWRSITFIGYNDATKQWDVDHNGVTEFMTTGDVDLYGVRAHYYPTTMVDSTQVRCSYGSRSDSSRILNYIFHSQPNGIKDDWLQFFELPCFNLYRNYGESPNKGTVSVVKNNEVLLSIPFTPLMNSHRMTKVHTVRPPGVNQSPYVQFRVKFW